MKIASTILVGALAAKQVTATWDLFAKKYNNPLQYDNQCDDDEKSGFNWGDLIDGQDVGSYKGYEFSGFKCSSKSDKRDHLTKRTFGTKAITGKITKNRGDGPKISCPSKEFSIDEMDVTVDYDVDVEFFYGMADGSTCKQVSSCKAGGSVVKNRQCAGAKEVTFKMKGDKPDCGINFHNIGFYCDAPQPPAYTPPAYTPPAVDSPSPSPTPAPTPEITPSSAAVVPSSIVTPEVPVSSAAVCEGYGDGTGYGPGCEEAPASSVVISTGLVGQTSAIVSSVVSSVVSPIETPSLVAPSSVAIVTSAVETPSGYLPPVEPPVVSSVVVPSSVVESVVVPSSAVESVVVPSSIVTPSAVVPESSVLAVPSSIVPVVPVSPSPSSVAPPPPTANCPNELQRCLNTWIFSVNCKDNADASCYCKDKEYVTAVINCVPSWSESDQIVSEALSYFVGICAPYIPENPAIITACPPDVPLTPPTAVPVSPPAETPVNDATPSAIITPAPLLPSAAPPALPLTTITVSQVVEVPCSECDDTPDAPAAPTMSTYTTTVTVPQVAFTTAPPAAEVPGATQAPPPQVELVQQSPAPVPANPTGYLAPTSLGTVTRVATPTGTPPAQFFGAAGHVEAGKFGLIAAAVVAFLAL